MRTLIPLLVLLVPLTASAQITFQRTYGGSINDFGYSVAQTDDSGYIVAGSTSSFGAGAQDVYLVKTDGAGDTLWTHTYGGSQNDYGYSVSQTDDGGYIIAGRTGSFGAGVYDVYLVRTDGAGDTVWTRSYGGLEYDYARSLARTDDGGYIIVGHTESFGAGNGDLYLIKTDAVGDTVWTRTYGGGEVEWPGSVARTDDGGYILVGQTESFGTGYGDVYLVKTDAVGDTVWTRTHGGTDYDTGYSVAQTVDGGYIIAGGTRSFGAGNYDLYLIKTDGAGDTVWTRVYGGTEWDFGSSVRQTYDGGYIIAGYTQSFGAGGADVYLVRADGAGDTVWTRTYGGSDDDYGESVEATDDGGFVIAGHTESYGAGMRDAYVIKTDSDGYVQITWNYDGIPRAQHHRLSQNYPNPFASCTAIAYSLASPTTVRVAVYDIRGARVRELVSGTLSPGPHQATWDGRDGRGREVGSGIYFCRLEAGEFSETRRMVLLR